MTNVEEYLSDEDLKRWGMLGVPDVPVKGPSGPQAGCAECKGNAAYRWVTAQTGPEGEPCGLCFPSK